MSKKKKIFQNCRRKENDCIEGDSIYIECRKSGIWNLIRMSGQHHGNCCTAKMNAKAVILKSYTNVKTK